MIRRAQRSEHDILTTISFRSKACWAYPEHYFQIWKNELIITCRYMVENRYARDSNADAV